MSFSTALLFISAATFAYYKYRQFIKWADNIPGYDEPFFSKPVFRGLFASRRKRIKIIMDFATKYPRMYRLMYGPIPKLFVTDPELVKKVLTSTKCLKKPNFYRFFGWGAGLATAPVDSWKLHRKLLNPAFGIAALQSFVPVFNECSSEFAKILEPHLNKGEFNLLEYSVNATLDSICATSFGINVEAQKKRLDFNKFLQRVHEIVHLRIINILYYSDFIFRLSKHFNEDLYVRKQCLTFGDKLIEQRKNIIKEMSDENAQTQRTYSSDLIPKKPKIFVDHLLTGEGCTFTESEIRDHVFTTISAGNETTALAVANAILFMAIHPEVQDRVVEELQQVFYDESIEMDYDKLTKLKYLDIVIKEVLRLCPSVPCFGRETTDDIELDGIMIPKGTEITMTAYAIHRRTQDWGPNPETFDPDRFLPENSVNRHPFSYVPFSGGTRNCIGRKYAIVSLKIMIFYLLKNYKFRTSLMWSDIKWKLDIHLHITKPHLVSIEKRQFYKEKKCVQEETQSLVKDI